MGFIRGGSSGSDDTRRVPEAYRSGVNEVVLLQSAQADLLEIFGLYGEASYRRIDSALEAICKMPELAPIYHDHFRRKLVEGTPYGIFYSVVGSRLMISFILDLRQDPSTIERHLKTGR